MENLWKKTQKMIISILMLALMVTMNAAASEPGNGDAQLLKDANDIRYTESTVPDKAVKASLTIHKYSYDGEGVQGSTGLPEDGTKLLPKGATPLQGVTFSYYKVGTLVQDKTTDGFGLRYQLDDVSGLTGLFELGTGVYTSAQLNAKLDAYIESAANGDYSSLENAVTSKLSGTVETDQYGVAQTGQVLAQGLYLVIETASPATVIEETAPFFVSLPMTNAAAVTADSKPYEAGRLWQYDVHVFPKNKEHFPDIEKNVENSTTGREEKYETAQIGEKVTFVIRVNIPENIAAMSKFNVVDTMSEGLTYAGDVSIQAGSASVTGVTAQQNTAGDYVWSFIDTANNVNRLTGHGGEELVIKYEAKLNENCVVAGEGNPNGVKLVYNASVSKEKEYDKEVEHKTKSRVYTFGISLTKKKQTTADGLEDLPGVQFELYKVTGTEGQEEKQEKINMEAKTAAGAVYYPDTAGTAAITTGQGGTANIIGLEPGTYYLKETKTEAGLILLSEPIKIEIKPEVTLGDAYNGEEGTYLSVADGTYGKLKLSEKEQLSVSSQEKYNFGTGDIFNYDEASGTYTPLDQDTLRYAKVTVTAGDGFTVDDGVVTFTVVNYPQFNMPSTGGMGTWAFTICGAVIIASALGLILIRRKRYMAK